MINIILSIKIINTVKRSKWFKKYKFLAKSIVRKNDIIIINLFISAKLKK